MHDFYMENDSEAEETNTTLELFFSRRIEEPTVVSEELLYEELEKFAPINRVISM